VIANELSQAIQRRLQTSPTHGGGSGAYQRSHGIIRLRDRSQILKEEGFQAYADIQRGVGQLPLRQTAVRYCFSRGRQPEWDLSVPFSSGLGVFCQEMFHIQVVNLPANTHGKLGHIK
jgi:hypothetical protein